MDFALVVLKLLMFNGCGIIGMSKIEFFSFSDTERVNKIGKEPELFFDLLLGFWNYFYCYITYIQIFHLNLEKLNKLWNKN